MRCFIVSVLAFVLTAWASACVTNVVVNYDFPSDISNEVYYAKNQAKEAIESKGTELKPVWDCKLTKHPGEKKFGQMWCWMSPELKQYVGGLCWGKRIEVGCNPQTGGEVWYEVEKHEFGHYWLMSNYHDWGHNAKYSDCFMNWRDLRDQVFFASDATQEQKVKMLKVVTESRNEGEWVSVNGIDTNGVWYHIDFVVSK